MVITFNHVTKLFEDDIPHVKSVIKKLKSLGNKWIEKEE